MTAIQKNLVEKNAAYVSSFKDGELALPPAKKYLVCKSILICSRVETRLSNHLQ
jgi:hypothetical protein